MLFTSSRPQCVKYDLLLMICKLQDQQSRNYGSRLRWIMIMTRRKLYESLSCHCYVTYICFTWLIYYAIYTYVRVCDLMEINTPINHATEVSENNMQITGSWMPPWVTEKTVYLTWSVLWLLMTGALYYQCIRISGVGPVILEYSNISARGTNTSKYRSTDDTISCGISDEIEQDREVLRVLTTICNKVWFNCTKLPWDGCSHVRTNWLNNSSQHFHISGHMIIIIVAHLFLGM